MTRRNLAGQAGLPAGVRDSHHNPTRPIDKKGEDAVITDSVLILICK
jgi:hypothetical protein